MTVSHAAEAGIRSGRSQRFPMPDHKKDPDLHQQPFKHDHTGRWHTTINKLEQSPDSQHVSADELSIVNRIILLQDNNVKMGLGA